ncbi:MAG: tRNA-dihydrouridine synthase [Patescibacteria group bacterium]
MNFWNEIKKPIFCLAPMADVTDRAFRRLIAKYSKQITPYQKSQGEPLTYVTWTEFVSADGLFLGGYDALINDLLFSEEERPIVAQFFTSKPEMMEKAAALAVELGFDGVDINMGCPDKSVEKQNAGAALMKNPNLAKEIILAAKRGAGDLPVSVKTRIGYNKNELEEWLPNLLETLPAVITIHARTRKEMSLVPARWEHVKRAVEIRDEIQEGRNKTLIFGNGDVENIADAEVKVKETGCDGVMFGRAILGRPWLFSNSRELENKEDFEVIRKILEILVEHTKLFEDLVLPKPPIGQGKNFAVMKKHFKAYVNGFNGSKELRIKLMNAENTNEVERIVNKFLLSYN